MQYKIFQVDAFGRGPFTGNPAAIVPLETWLDDSTLQSIAQENNLSETAFFVQRADRYSIRWFTPKVEVDLCGHATLAAGHVLFYELNYPKDMITFQSRSGDISVAKKGEHLELDFPIDNLRSSKKPPSEFEKGLSARPVEVFEGKDDYLCIFNSSEEVRQLKPDFKALIEVGKRGVIVTSLGEPSEKWDFVSRGFFPQSGIDEDPATGSAHTTLTKYWSEKTGKLSFNACQLSSRKGYFMCTVNQDRVKISGATHLYMKGEILI